MSRLTDLIKQVEQQNPQLAADLGKEVGALSKRRAFGLNFERHTPETVELPGRPVRRGDKVRLLPDREDPKAKQDHRLWRVASISRTDNGRIANVVDLTPSEGDAERQAVSVDDVVVVAEFRDPIYPGLVSTGKVERGGGKPYHTVINSENFHALQALLYTHEGKVDAIYIDPPYNTGAKDWKYNNDYVDGEDAYRHSKWLAFMERRLKLAKRLLNPDDSVLIVTIDEKEYLRLGMLLEQTFPDAKIQMVSSVISQKGSARAGEFSRCDEYLYFVQVGAAQPMPQRTDMLHERTTDVGDEVEWGRLTRNGANGRRSARPNLYYPIFFAKNGTYHSTGSPLDPNENRSNIVAPDGTIAVFPTATNGTEMSWSLSHTKFSEYVAKEYVKFGKLRPDAPQPVRIYYLTSGYVAAAEAGDIIRDHSKQAVRWLHKAPKGMKPLTVWNVASHNAAEGGTNLLKRLLPDRRFPFPKSLYAVEDALRFFLSEKPNGLVIDFFSGSGTTAHAVMRLNKQDEGHRRSISVTNNEVSPDEQAKLRKQGLRPGDDEWECLGICDYITKPRIQAAITGRTPDNNPIEGDYKFTDEFPMSDGLDENVEFFTLTYEAPRTVAHNRAFEKIAPLLWLRAGSEGRRIDKVSDTYDVADTYGVLFSLDSSREFIAEFSSRETLRTAYIVTDDDGAFQMVCAGLPTHVEPVRLYESYLTNFTINTGVDAP